MVQSAALYCLGGDVNVNLQSTQTRALQWRDRIIHWSHDLIPNLNLFLRSAESAACCDLVSQDENSTNPSTVYVAGRMWWHDYRVYEAEAKTKTNEAEGRGK
jgi:hypothetical protein